MMALAEVNALDRVGFIASFGDIAEHSPWVAEAASALRPFASRDAMIAAFELGFRNGNHTARLATLRAHPDLATRAKLTPDSEREQSAAGLDTLTPEEHVRFTELNTAYKAKFGFPFIFAVKGATKHDILKGFESRIVNTSDMEFETALKQVCRIFRFRLEDRVMA